MHAARQTLHANIETVANAKRSWCSRTSVRLILDDGSGHVGLGEAAPLAGFSPESATEARRAVEAMSWPARTPTDLAAAQALVERIDPALPSAPFAAESSDARPPRRAPATDRAAEVAERQDRRRSAATCADRAA